MNKLLLTAALAGVMAASVTASAQADSQEKEKCYGIAKIGKNDCKSANGSHNCANMAKKNNDPNEWVNVAKGTCEKDGGTLQPKV